MLEEQNISGYEKAEIYVPFKRYKEGGGYLPANAAYCYNYDGAPTDGYSFPDDCGYGNKIEYIPEDPTREGYTFGGWYKEAECINEWDFDGDTLPEEEFELDEDGRKQIAYQETKLYAKWL